MKLQMPDDPPAAFQMAPMIDVVFLLIIFFMVAADMNQQERVPVEIPVANHAVRPEDPSGRGTITVKPNGDVFAGAQPVTLDQLGDLARTRLAENPNFKLFLRADRKTPHEHVREVMRVAAEAGVSDIIFATYTGD
jgi:biopolymer transport protein ExbD